eukprot:TRINITY_DN22977_c0_g1_i10.p1 TRINITY_DN22977_c0_g1~~TRINITY_DN22977_c0_g1_i10.p1  ORF type:complete len:546 (-),score=34.08 TRINITY_DN22977_c0_g1_i10:471-2108(-)
MTNTCVGFRQRLARRLQRLHLSTTRRRSFQFPNNSHRQLNIVFVSTEVAPWSKVGGLGDVLGALPEKLAARGHRVMTVAPKYEHYEDIDDTQLRVQINTSDQDFWGSEHAEAQYFSKQINGVERVFIASKAYESDHGNGVMAMYSSYNNDCTSPSSRFIDRLSILNQAALSAPYILWNCQNDALVFIVNDWPCCLLPLYLKPHINGFDKMEKEQITSNCNNNSYNCNNDNSEEADNFFVDQLVQIATKNDTRVVLALHNGAHKGPKAPLQQINCPGLDSSKIYEWIASKAKDVVSNREISTNKELRNWWQRLICQCSHPTNSCSCTNFDEIYWLQVGIMACDVVVTVSPTYASEIQKPGLQGDDLWQALRGSTKVCGILNGTDTNIWNPCYDEKIPEMYSQVSARFGKRIAKQKLQQRLGLEIRDDIPLIGFIGRLDQQKGVNAMLSALYSMFPPKIPTVDCSSQFVENVSLQVCFLGSGDLQLERSIRLLQYTFPGYANGYVGFSEEMAHLMLAGCDYLMIPSVFEPCGLVALHAQIYGAVPFL